MPVIVNPNNPRATTSPAVISGQLNPWDNPSAFDLIVVNSVTAAGIVKKVTAKLSQKFDVQSAPGINGAYVIFKGYEAAKVTIEMQVWTRDGWEAFDTTLDQCAPKPVKGTPKAVNVDNPLLKKHRLKALFVNDIDGLEEQECGLWTYKLNCLEFFPPPKARAQSKLEAPTPSDFVGPPLPPARKPSTGKILP